MLAAVVSFSIGTLGCSDQAPPPATNDTTQALSNFEFFYEYYSDDTYTVQVGSHSGSCTGLPSSSGTRTRFIIGEQTRCPPPHTTLGCWQVINGSNFCGYDACTSCF
jgi:hypothetical protein